MNLSTIEMDPAEARARLAEYETALKQERTVQDEALAMGYRAAARGLPIIRLSQTVAAGGFFESGLPRIAVIRATERECFARWHGDDILYGSDNRWDNRGALVGQYIVRVPLPGHRPERAWSTGRTIVPLIPPRHRPR